MLPRLRPVDRPPVQNQHMFGTEGVASSRVRSFCRNGCIRISVYRCRPSSLQNVAFLVFLIKQKQGQVSLNCTDMQGFFKWKLLSCSSARALPFTNSTSTSGSWRGLRADETLGCFQILDQGTFHRTACVTVGRFMNFIYWLQMGRLKIWYPDRACPPLSRL